MRDTFKAFALSPELLRRIKAYAENRSTPYRRMSESSVIREALEAFLPPEENRDRHLDAVAEEESNGD